MTPTTFSIILSAAWSFSVWVPSCNAPNSSSESAVRSRSASMRVAMSILKKFGMRDPGFSAVVCVFAVMASSPARQAQVDPSILPILLPNPSRATGPTPA